MKANQANASVDLLRSVLSTEATVKVWKHGDGDSDTPMGHIVSVVAKTGDTSRQWLFHRVEQVGDFITNLPPELKSGRR